MFHPRQFGSIENMSLWLSTILSPKSLLKFTYIHMVTNKNTYNKVKFQNLCRRLLIFYLKLRQLSSSRTKIPNLNLVYFTKLTFKFYAQETFPKALFHTSKSHISFIQKPHCVLPDQKFCNFCTLNYLLKQKQWRSKITQILIGLQCSEPGFCHYLLGNVC